MSGRSQQIVVQVETSAADEAAALEELTRNLRREILNLDVDSVEIPDAGPAPEGAKGEAAFDLGKLLITLANPSGLLVNVVKAVDGWIRAQGVRSVSLEIDGDKLQLTGLSSEDQKALIEHWISRHRE